MSSQRKKGGALHVSNPTQRIVCWFSCGVTSAVATKLTIDANPTNPDVRVVYCDTRSEEPDNERFMRDCEQWFGVRVEVIASEKYHDIWDVFEKTGWLVGPGGARCSTELKRRPRLDYQHPDDIHVFGHDAGEAERAATFLANNHDVRVSQPLIDAGLDKPECARRVMLAGIEIPRMYRLGYPNANCVGCVKGGMSYWRQIRRDFPDVFERMSKVERKMDVAICKSYAGDGERKRVFLDELPEGLGNMMKEPDFSCGIGCGVQADLFDIEGNK